jgi:hypothetical protein
MLDVSTFLPKDYEIKESGSDFYKFEDGDNKFRVLTPAHIGLEGWKDSKPFRRSGKGATITPDEVDMDYKFAAEGKPKISEFWAFYVYSHRDEKVMILSITQQSIKKGIMAFAQDEEWGNPEAYDLTVTRSDNNGKVTYSVKPSPAKPLAKAAQATVDAVSGKFDIVKALNIEEVA